MLVLLLGVAMIWCMRRLRRQRGRQQAGAPVTGSKVDVESDSSSSGGGGQDSDGKDSRTPSCWPFGASHANKRAKHNSRGADANTHNAGDTGSSTKSYP